MKRVLICDDETIIRQGICALLSRTFGELEIREAENGMDGYKLMALWHPDVVITDIRMPVMSGLDMLEKAEQSRIPFTAVVISAYSDFEYARTAIRFGVREYILKPVNRFELIACLNRIWGLKDQPPSAADESTGSIGKAIRYIENHYYQNIGLEDVAREVGMNANYLSSLFKKQCGMRYIEYLTNLRLEKAKSLIQNTDLKISVIAEMVGYNSTKHFSRLYKEKYRISPGEERITV